MIIICCIRPQRLAELIAGSLRERILDGEIPDGGELPALPSLVAEFGVSAPPVREALRILEHERLITVRRGVKGGAVVHRPKADAVGYVLGTVLQGERVPTADLRLALAELQPVCAAMCARRSDRGRTVVPRLTASCDAMADAIDDPRAMEPVSRQFHAELIAGCGNSTLVLVVGALEQLWATQQEAWTHRVAVADESPDIELRKQGLQAHVDITTAIEDGDAEAADRLVREHMGDPRIFTARKKGPVIRATP